LWEDYMDAYENTLNSTSTAEAPWYAIPADNKPYARMTVARIIVDAMNSLDCRYPEVAAGEKQNFGEMKKQLLEDN